MPNCLSKYRLMFTGGANKQELTDAAQNYIDGRFGYTIHLDTCSSRHLFRLTSTKLQFFPMHTFQRPLMCLLVIPLFSLMKLTASLL